MKKYVRLLSVVLTCGNICVVGASEDVDQVDARKAVSNCLSCIAGYGNWILHCAPYSSCDSKAATRGLIESYSEKLELVIHELLSNGKYKAGLSMPGFVEQEFKKTTFAIAVNPTESIKKIVEALKGYIANSTPVLFNKLLETNQYKEAWDFATAFSEMNASQSIEWLQQIQEKATAKIENSARKVALFSSVAPNLEVEERVQALTIIKAFPKEDEIRVHLQSRYDAILSASVPIVSTVAALEFARRIVDSL